MSMNKLSGIERELVLQYLIDGNVPVTITPIDDATENEDVPHLSTVVFPVAIKPDNISVLKEGIILLKNPNSSVSNFEGKDVKVEFYFNRVGLFFVTQVKSVKAGLALVIPAEIQRIQDVEVVQKYDFSAILFYSVDSNKDINFKCFPADGFELFSRPVWSSIPLELQAKAKSYLEEYVEIAKKTKKAGNGLQLINICRYMVFNTIEKIEAIQGKVKPFDILFVNHERIVLGYNKNDAIELDVGKEYALKMSFSLKDSSVVTRDVFVTFSVDNQYFSDDNKKICVDCSYTTLQEEDCRFLYEKATKTLFV